MHLMGYFHRALTGTKRTEGRVREKLESKADIAWFGLVWEARLIEPPLGDLRLSMTIYTYIQ
jgi:hypothetical protein